MMTTKQAAIAQIKTKCESIFIALTRLTTQCGSSKHLQAAAGAKCRINDSEHGVVRPCALEVTVGKCACDMKVTAGSVQHMQCAAKSASHAYEDSWLKRQSQR